MSISNTKVKNTAAIEVNAAACLEKFIKNNYKIFIDTCSLLDSGFPVFFENIKPMLLKYGKSIIVPCVVNGELMELGKNQDKPQLQIPAFNALKLIQHYLGTLFDVRGEEGDSFPDNLFLSIYIKFRMKYNILFITQDRSLAADILNNNSSGSVQAHPAIVRRLNSYGYLSTPQIIRDHGIWKVPDYSTVPMNRLLTSQSLSAFKKCTEMTPMQDQQMEITELPGEYDTVFAMNKKTNQYSEVQLTAKLASGGEGCVYATDTEYVAKIYKEKCITARRMEKVYRMSKKELKCNGICFPVGPLLNSHNEFVGYLMPKAQGKELGKSAFLPFVRNAFPEWKRQDLVQLCVTILRKMEYLHSKNILIGDINPANILVVSSEEVYFVDTDSYQIEDLPCPVGQVNYTAPEIQGKNFSDFLRTMGNEDFAVATLLFQILLTGKLPYAHQGGGNPGDNIKGMNFSYCLGINGSGKTPEGLWRYMWSHLPYTIKQAFFDTFTKNGAHSSEAARIGSGAWIKMMKKYLELLQDGTLAANDPMSAALLPNRFKARPGSKFATCRVCGEAFPYMEKEGMPIPKYCPHCKTEVKEWITCETCGEEFPFTGGEFEFYEARHLSLPKRCPACRSKRDTATPVKTAQPKPQPDPAPPKGKWGWFNLSHLFT